MIEDFAGQSNFPHYQLKDPKIVNVIHGGPITSSDIIEYIYVDYTIGDHHEYMVAYIV
jgi:hypothetical protein